MDKVLRRRASYSVIVPELARTLLVTIITFGTQFSCLYGLINIKERNITACLTAQGP